MFKRLVVTVIALCAPLVPASANDFEGDSRPQGTMCDIGADEVAP